MNFFNRLIYIFIYAYWLLIKLSYTYIYYYCLKQICRVNRMNDKTWFSLNFILRDQSYFFLKLFLLKMLFEQRFVTILQITMNCIIFEGCFCRRFVFFFFNNIIPFFSFFFFFIHIYLYFRRKKETFDQWSLADASFGT